MEEPKYQILKLILKYKKTNIISINLLLITILMVVMFVIPKQYTAQVSILPAAANFSQGLASKLGGLGKIAGLDFNITSGQSQEMFMGILTSTLLLEKVAFYDYEFQHSDHEAKMNLVTFFKIKGKSEREIKEKVLKKIREDVISMSLDNENDILYLSTTTPNPFLSAQVANRMCTILNDIVKQEVQKEFRLKLAYLNKRIAEIQDSLKIAETELKNFLETNIDPTLPSFQIQQLRFRRNVEIQTELYIEFRKQIEVFIADTMINLADIKVLDSAEAPFRKSRPKRLLLLISLSMLAVLIQVGVNASVLIYKNIRTEFMRNSG